jgi:epoxyqueuosine reductase
MVYGCDVCQDVCPWNRAVERRRAGASSSADSMPTVSLREWLERDGEQLVAEFDRLYVPRNDPKWLRRNALVAAGNVGTEAVVPFVEDYADDADAMLRETAAWALGRITGRSA